MNLFRTLFPHLFFACVLLLLGACGSEQTQQTQTAAEPDQIKLSNKQLELMDIKVLAVETKAINTTIYTTGKVASLPNNEAQVSSVVTGRIDKIFVIEGSRIRKGQPLMILSSFELIELQNQYMIAKSEREFTEKDYKRQNELRQNNIGALADYQITESRFKSALSNEKALEAKLELLGINTDNLKDPEKATIRQQITILSPLDGFVYKLHAIVGMRTSPETVLAEIINNSKLFADLFLYEREINYIKEGQAVEIEFANKSIPKTKGKVVYISQAIDEETKTIPVHVEFEAQGAYAIFPDMNIKAKISGLASKQTGNVVPLAALVYDGPSVFIYCCTKEAKDSVQFTRCRCEVIKKDDNYAEVVLMNKKIAVDKIASSNANMLDVEFKNRAAGN